MKSKVVFLLALLLIGGSVVTGQPTRRLAVMAAHGPLASSNGGFAIVEMSVADGLTAKLIGLPGVTLIDRAFVDKILKEQNFQNSDRSSADTATRIGKLLGVSQIVLVQLTGASYTTHLEQSGNTTRNIGTVALGASARMIDVETGVIQAQPSSDFKDSVVISEATKAQVYGPIRTPARVKSSGDPKVIQDNEWGKAAASVVNDLASQLASTVRAAPAANTGSPLVAGIVNGAVYINQGSAIGIKAGDKFQIMREVSLGLNDPATGKPMMQRQRVCVLTVVNASESNSSGKCEGGLPQTKDVAEPLR